MFVTKKLLEFSFIPCKDEKEAIVQKDYLTSEVKCWLDGAKDISF